MYDTFKLLVFFPETVFTFGRVILSSLIDIFTLQNIVNKNV